MHPQRATARVTVVTASIVQERQSSKCTTGRCRTHRSTAEYATGIATRLCGDTLQPTHKHAAKSSTWSSAAAVLAFEQMREAAAALYRDETGSSWKPVSGSRTSHSRHLTSAVIDARDFLRARAENRRHALIPEGTPIVFAGGRQTFESAEDARVYADNIWATLDKVRDATFG